MAHALVERVVIGLGVRITVPVITDEVVAVLDDTILLVAKASTESGVGVVNACVHDSDADTLSGFCAAATLARMPHADGENILLQMFKENVTEGSVVEHGQSTHTAFSVKLVNLGHHMGREFVLCLVLGKRVFTCDGHVVEPGDGSIGIVHEVLALGVGYGVVPERPHLLDSGHGGNHGHLSVLFDHGVVYAKRSALKQGEVKIHPWDGLDAVCVHAGEEGGIVLDGCQYMKEGSEVHQGNEHDHQRTPRGTFPG